MGDTKGGPFDIDAEMALQLRYHPNPDGRPNANVVRRWINGSDITALFALPQPVDEASKARMSAGVVESDAPE